MKEFKVRNEWLVNENNEIVKMTLREWIEYFDIKPHKCLINNREWQTYISTRKTERNGLIDIYKRGGYGLPHNELNDYLDKVFRSGNADFDVKLVEVG